MLCTPAVLTVMVTDFCCGWGNAMVITMTPTFMKVCYTCPCTCTCSWTVFQEVLGYDIAGNGAVSMLPHLSRAIIGQVGQTKLLHLCYSLYLQCCPHLLPIAYSIL